MNCKTLNLRYIIARLMLCMTFMVLSCSAFSQKIVSGNVTDESNQPLIGVTVALQGTTVGTITDIDGNYSLSIPSGNDDKPIVFSFIGYENVTTNIPTAGKLNVQMRPAVTELEEIVAIGYGTKRKGDMTGSIASVSEKDFNGGVVSSPEQLINGKVAGVQITNGGGSPSGGSTIKIRGGASLNASNNPLIVLDGVPLENGGISGNDNNFLSLINPNDIESMTILKDASSTAIYGSRASNGVIIINTKKGQSGKPKINFTTTNSVSFKTKLPEMLSREEFIQAINEMKDIDDVTANIGTANTDWNDEIYHAAFGTDNNLSVSGKQGFLPYRVSFGYSDQNGILLNDNVKRTTASVNLTPTFFDEHLKVNASFKGAINKNTFGNNGAIGAAITANPTMPVHDQNSIYGGYYEVTNPDGTLQTSAAKNPLGLVEQNENTSTVKRAIANLDLDYKMHFLPDLKAHVTLGGDFAKGEGDIFIPAEAAEQNASGGRKYTYGPEKNSNKLFTAYLNYNKKWGILYFDATAGYDYQNWHSEHPSYPELNVAQDIQKTIAAKDQTHVLLSYYGRVNFTLADKYMVTATIRRDGSSRFSEDNRWGSFPSVALAWRLSGEDFMSGISWINNLKLRASYGVTGQQDGIGNYAYLPVYKISQPGALYQLGDYYYYIFRPSAYDEKLTWETTKAYNLGLDFGFFNSKVYGTLDIYTRKTENLLAKIPVAGGTNFAKSILSNAGNVESKGVEFEISGVVYDKKDFGWTVSFNSTWQKNEITNLSIVDNGEVVSTEAGPTIDNHFVQALREGETPYVFRLYHQIYDENGKPLEGVYADLDGDGQESSGDKYSAHSPAPDWIFGFSTQFRYKKWTLSTSLRANLGNYVFNGISMNYGSSSSAHWGEKDLNNFAASYKETKFIGRQYYSDYYLENASFLKMDNISLGYNFGQITPWCSLNASAMIQNVFTVTKYNGTDPEIANGVDNNFYPRPRVFSITLGFNFL